MRLIKRLLLLAVVVGLAGAALWLWQSPYFALHQIDKGLAERDVVRVERYVDLEAVVRSTAQLFGELASDKVGSGPDIGSQILGALIGGVAERIGDAAALQGAVELRRAIQEGRVERSLGPFVLHDGWRALGGVQLLDATALVTLHGTCRGQAAKLRVVFERKDGATFGYPRRYVLTGADKESMAELARACRAAAR